MCANELTVDINGLVVTKGRVVEETGIELNERAVFASDGNASSKGSSLGGITDVECGFQAV
jgi:hypothetical protein